MYQQVKAVCQQCGVKFEQTNMFTYVTCPNCCHKQAKE